MWPPTTLLLCGSFSMLWETENGVLEGYAMNPNPQYGTPASRIKAMSTGTLFQSPRDAMQDARGHQLNSLITPRKRHRSASPIDNGAVDETYNEEESMSIDVGRQPERPVKPLKKTARSMLQSKSLPAGALFPGQSQTILQGDLRETDEEENDWSSDLTFQASASSITFEPTLMP
ncbi:hypothetical protein HHX47_DHR5000906 [Lentinula edodes]|nr:hypothetical protein HHX47_DHR5000906 [Lentinula edodes]